MRHATSADYEWLYANTDYMKSGQIDRAKEAIKWINKDDPVVEFGCGRGDLARHMRLQGYIWTARDYISPGVFKYIEFHTTVSIDVMEHLSEQEMERMLFYVLPCANKHVWAIANMSDIHTVNGEEVELHTIQKPWTWWAERIRRYWPGKITQETINCHRFLLVMER